MAGRVVVAGASGGLGKALLAGLKARGYETVALSRSTRPIRFADRIAVWDGETLGEWIQEIEGAFAVINLSGSPIAVKWSDANRKTILDSRVLSTRAVGQAIQAANAKPKVWLNGSAVGFYGDRGDEILTESSPIGTGFLSEVCQQWEAEAERFATEGVRLALIRTGVVLSRDSGFYALLSKLTRWFLGGHVGSGKPFISWIHEADWVAMTLWAMESDVSGPLLVVGPDPARLRDVMAALRKSLRRPWCPPAPSFVPTILSWFGGPDPVLSQVSERCIPEKAQQMGFSFRYASLDSALEELASRSGDSDSGSAISAST